MATRARQHGSRPTPSGSGRGHARPAALGGLLSRLLKVHEEEGRLIAAIVDRCRGQSAAQAPPTSLHAIRHNEDEKPCWNEDAMTLYWHGGVEKEYRNPADSQRAVLAAFQKNCWTRSIKNPLLLDGRINRRRLEHTVRDLNKGLRHLRFETYGCCEGVRWEVKKTNSPVAHRRHPDRSRSSGCGSR